MDKEISYEQLIDTTDADAEFEECIYDGVTVKIKSRLSLADILQIADDVAEGCFLDDGSYYPELVYFLERRSVIRNMTNVELPEDLSKCYDFVMYSDFSNCVYDAVMVQNEFMIYDLEDAIQRKLNYMADSGIAALHNKMNELFMALDNFAEQSAELFGGITVEDRDRLISAVDSIGGLDEERLVKAFVKQDKKTKAKKYTEK